MQEDTITVKIRVTADYPTLQALRAGLAETPTASQFHDYLTRAINKGLSHVIDQPLELETEITAPAYHHVKTGARDPIPKVEGGILTWFDPYENRLNTVGKVGSVEWHEWLAQESNKSFHYVSKHGATFTAMKRKDGKYYAYKRLGGKLKRKYLGTAKTVTAKKMDKVAFELAQRELR
jgi:hypothetical protein